MSDMSLLQDFVTETTEHLQEMESNLISLAPGPVDPEILNDIFRSVHTIKGAANYLGMARIAELTHKLENLLDLLRQAEREIDQALIDTLIKGNDRIAQLVEDLEQDGSEKAEIDDLVEAIAILTENAESTAGMAVESEPSGSEAPAEDIPEAVEPEADTATAAPQPAGNVTEAETSDQTGTQAVYEEEYDRELFRIFHRQLEEGLENLRDQAGHLMETEDRKGVLDACLGTLNALRSSANYMGYDRVVQIYDRWTEDVHRLNEELASGGSIEWAEVIRTGFDGPMESVRDLFPPPEMVADNIPSPDTAGQGDGSEIGEIENLVDDILFADVETTSDPDSIEGDIDRLLMDQDKSPEAEPAAGQTQGLDLALVDDFVEETREHLAALESSLIRMADNVSDAKAVGDVFRSVHTIKGASEYLGLLGIAGLSHRVEDLLDLIRQGNLKAERSIVDILIEGCDRIGHLVDDIESGGEENTDTADLIARLEEVRVAPGKAAPIDSVVEPAGADPESAVYEEEYDEELFGIFLQQLGDGIDSIWTVLSDEDGTADAESVYDICLETLAALRSSANYMGYDLATRLYDEWSDQIAGMQAGGDGDESFDLSKFTNSVIRPRIGELLGMFPKAADVIPTDLIDTAVAATPKAPAAETDAGLMGKLEDAFDNLVSVFDSGAAGQDSQVEAELFSSEMATGTTAPPSESPEKPSVSATAGIETPPGEPERLIPDDLEAALIDAPPVEDLLAVETEPVLSEEEELEKEAAELEARLAQEQEEEEKTLEGQPLPFMEEAGRRSQFRLGRRESDKFSEKMLKQSIRVDAKKIDSLMNQVGELVVNRAYFAQLFNDMKDLQQNLQQNTDLDQREMKQVKEFTFKLSEATVSLGRAANDLQEGVMKVRMLPIAQLFNRYPRLVHDLVRDTGKQVRLEIKGEETELDKMVIEQISDPLIHIIRNAVDHGIESPEDRIKNGKPEMGRLLLEASHESNHVVIEITDDGGGIDIERIKDKAVLSELYQREELDQMSEKDLISLIMRPSFSTADEVTQTSGRGVGMDVVKKNIEKLNGTIEIESILGVETHIRLKIPLTLAIIAALLVRVGGELFTIPLTTVDETIRIHDDDLTTIEGVEVMHFRDTTLPILRLTNMFNMVELYPDRKQHFVVIVSSGLKRLGLVVDELMGQEEVVIKPLEDYLQEKSGFSGATILGDGGISLILDIYELMTLTIKKQARKQSETALF